MARIVHWGKYFPPDMGGIESVTYSVARAAASAGHEVAVVCFDRAGAPDVEVIDGIRVLRAAQWASVASQPLVWRYARLAVREGRRADLIHLHVPNMLGALAALLVGKKARLLVHWHSDVVGKGSIGAVLMPLERAMLRRADLVVCTSQAYADGSETLKPFLHKVRVVPLGTPDVDAQMPHAAQVRLPAGLEKKIAGKRLVLAVGRLVPYKGFDVLVNAAQDLPHDAAVVIVGAGPLHGDLQSRIEKLQVGDRVTLAGRVSNEEKDELFRRAAVFCLPSIERSEAFGVAIVEAMSYGVPVVATQIRGSGVPWVNQHDVSGLNVPVADAKALGAAVNRILGSDEVRRRLAAGARDRFVHEFTEAISTERILTAYRSLGVTGAAS